MLGFFKTLIAAFFIFLLTDYVWLTFIAKGMYLESYASLLRLENGALKPLYWAGFMVYLLFALSLIIFILPLAQGSILKALAYGAALGALVYGTYDFTCLAVFKDFPLRASLIDWAWGTVLFAWASVWTLIISR